MYLLPHLENTLSNVTDYELMIYLDTLFECQDERIDQQIDKIDPTLVMETLNDLSVTDHIVFRRLTTFKVGERITKANLSLLRTLDFTRKQVTQYETNQYELCSNCQMSKLKSQSCIC